MFQLLRWVEEAMRIKEGIDQAMLSWRREREAAAHRQAELRR